VDITTVPLPAVATPTPLVTKTSPPIDENDVPAVKIRSLPSPPLDDPTSNDIDPETLDPDAQPVDNRIAPVEFAVESPVVRLIDPEEPPDDDIDVLRSMSPEAEGPSPVSKKNPPPLLLDCCPPYKANRAPLEDPPLPAENAIWPPLSSTDKPAVRLILPPIASFPSPTVSSMLPPASSVDNPVSMLIDPEGPVEALPVETVINPLPSALDESAVENIRFPLALEAPAPETTTTSPPANEPSALPAEI
jgi:hypothetical protein